MSKLFGTLLLLCLVSATQALAQSAPSGEAASAAAKSSSLGASFQADLAELTAAPHRLAGTPEGLKASQYVEKRLRQMGVDEVYIQNFPVPLCHFTQCSMSCDGKDVEVLPLRPNLFQGSVTPEEGLTGRTLYVGQGRLEDYKESAKARIVVLDFSAGRNWLTAFALGAKAVVFIGQDEPVDSVFHHLNMSAFLPRYYISSAVAEKFGFKTAPHEVTIKSACQWEMRQGRNVIGVIRGSGAKFNFPRSEAIMLSAALDSLSEVPQLSPGARGAANCATLLSLAEYFKANRAKRDVIIAFFDGDAQSHAGARAFFGDLYRIKGQYNIAKDNNLPFDTLWARQKMLQDEQSWLESVRKVFEQGDIFSGLASHMTNHDDAVKRIRAEAKNLSGDLRERLQVMRVQEMDMATGIDGLRREQPNGTTQPTDNSAGQLVELTAKLAKLRADIAAIDEEDRLWNHVLRALFSSQHPLDPGFKIKPGEEVDRAELGKYYDVALRQARDVVAARQRELAEELQRMQQSLAIANAIGDDREMIVLDLVVNLSDSSPAWTFIHGEDSENVHWQSDHQSQYNNVFRAIRESAPTGRITEIKGSTLTIQPSDSSDKPFTVELKGGAVCRIDGAEAKLSDLKPGLYVCADQTPGFDVSVMAYSGPLANLETRPLEMLYNIRMFMPGRVAHNGCIAGSFGVYNLALTTPLDRRPREGQPCDVVARTDGAGRSVPVLNVENMIQARQEMECFLLGLANDPRLSLESFGPEVTMVESSFSDGKDQGPSVMMLSSASASADTPARGAFVAILPPEFISNGGTPQMELWRTDLLPPGYEPFCMVKVATTGRYNLPAVSAYGYVINKAPMIWSAMWNERGLIDRVNTTRSTYAQPPLTSAATTLCQSLGMTIVGFGYDRRAIVTQQLKAASTSPLSEDRSFSIESGNVLTLFARNDINNIKLFNSLGLVMLGNNAADDRITGKGYSLDPLAHWPAAAIAAHDLHNLNSGRLAMLKEHHILEPSLELLHSTAGDLLAKADGMDASRVSEQTGKEAASAAISRAVYRPLLAVINDLVVAVVLLLLLSIPFAYALERLIVGTPYIYRQIGWFVFFFLVTFVVLFAVNPAFRIAATPSIIFLAFAIILLSGLVMVIMSRKLEAEIRRMRGLGSSVHSSDVSRLSTMSAAIAMGISTMRRRPIRTLLTATTVVLLTFTILTFASFSSSYGNRRTSAGPLSGPPRVMVRSPLWSRISDEVVAALQGHLAGQATVVPRLWVSPMALEAEVNRAAARVNRELLVCESSGKKIVSLSAAIGLDSRDLAQLSELRDVLGGQSDKLADDGIFLADSVARQLQLKVGDSLLLDGLACKLAGVIDTRKVTNYRLLEGSSMLPVDYAASGGGTASGYNSQESSAASGKAADSEGASAQFITFAAERVAIMPSAMAKRLGGRVVSFNVYPADPTELDRMGQQISTMTQLPTYVGSGGGVSRLIFASLAEASGWKDLVIPVVLGGLIIFATMLGSVSDREKEIYAFSALGLAPPHVASLFFAEAGVYAVVGGMGGYLLGQIVARGMAVVSEYMGLLSVPTMNYSSTNAVVTVLVVMGTVLVSTIYPALKASRSANPGIQRQWRIPKPREDHYDIVFPFTVSAYDITGVLSFLKEHFDNYSDTALGTFTASRTRIFRQDGREMLGMEAEVALAPFDLGVSQQFALLARPSEIAGIDEIRILLARRSGTRGDWQRSNKVFVSELRRQLLIWRSLGPDIMEKYRQKTLQQWNELPTQTIDPETFGA